MDFVSTRDLFFNLSFPQFNMHSLLAIPLLLTSVINKSPLEDLPASSSLSSWLSIENGIALQGVLDNIGANGSAAAGASPGIVIASPSTDDPDCVEFSRKNTF